MAATTPAACVPRKVVRRQAIRPWKQQPWFALAWRVALPSALCVVLFSITVFGLILPAAHQQLLERKKETIRTLTQSACSALERYHARQQAGELTRAAAQRRALAHLRSLRYGDEGKDYFWVNDLAPRMLMHPYQPELNGQDLTGYEDPHGTRLFVEAAQIARTEGSGFIDYVWQWKDDPTRLAPKLSYVQLFEPWGWVVGTGIYIEDVTAEVTAMTRQLTTATALIILLVAVLSAFVIWQSYQIDRRRSLAEQNLRMLSTGLAESHEGVAMSDLDGNLIYVNKSFAALHDYQVDELVGQHLRACHTEDQMPAVRAAVDQVLAAGTFEGELPHARRDQTVFPGLMHLSLVHDDAGIPIAIAGTLQDITDRKQRERELQDSEARFRTMIEHAPEAIVVVDADSGRYVDANEKVESLAGVDRATLLTLGPRDLAPPTQPDGRPSELVAREAMDEALLTGSATLEWTGRRPDGTDVCTEVRLVPLPAAGRRLLRGSVIDIGDRKRMEAERQALQEQLHQSQKMEAIGQLSSGVAHDFNNLLTVILCSVEQLRSELLRETAGSRALHAIEQAAEQATGVTRALLTFTHRVPMEKKPTQLAETVDRATRLLQRLLPAAVKLNVQHDCPEPLWVTADATQLQQILINLAVNARDAMPDGGYLQITTSAIPPGSADQPGPVACLTVRDTGTGIPPEVQARMFEPFFTTKPHGQGTGLGLPIVQSIVDAHEGELHVTSELGVGTTFTITLPRLISPQHDQHSQPTPATASGQGESILVAEDDDTARALIIGKLRSLGYDAIGVADGETALATIARSMPRARLLIVDVDLPRRTGLQCLQTLRHAGNKIPIILVTGNVTLDLEDYADAQTFPLRKPFGLAELQAAVAEALNSRRELSA